LLSRANPGNPSRDYCESLSGDSELLFAEIGDLLNERHCVGAAMNRRPDGTRSNGEALTVDSSTIIF
jgi:hypothetical protein